MANNIKDLRNELLETFKEFKNGTIKRGDAKEIANLAGKIISSAKVEIDYAKLTKSTVKIDFLEYDEEEPKEIKGDESM